MLFQVGVNRYMCMCVHCKMRFLCCKWCVVHMTMAHIIPAIDMGSVPAIDAVNGD